MGTTRQLQHELQCPGCGGPMLTATVHDVEIDRCTRCEALWLDQGELLPFVEHELIRDPSIPEAHPLVNTRPRRAPRRSAGRTCPRCEAPLRRFQFAYDSGVYPDKCGGCDGVFVERDDLERIASHVKGNELSRGLGRSIIEHHRELDGWRGITRTARDLSVRRGIYAFGPKLFLPVAAEDRTGRIPVVALALIAINVVVGVGMGALDEAGLTSFIGRYGFVPAEFFAGERLYTLFTSGFLHGGPWHLISNMLFLWVFAGNVEGRIGSLRFLGLYLAAEVIATLAHGVIDIGSTTPMVGASGAISGVMGAFLVLYPRAKLKMLFIARVIDVPAWTYLGMWILLQVPGSLGALHGCSGGVAWLAHVGGFAAGVVGMILWRKVVEDAKPEGRLGDAVG